MSTVRKFISAILHSGKIGEWAQGGSIDYLFKNTELPYFEFVDTHVRKHGTLPHPDTFELHTGAELPEANEPASYYRELLFDRYVELELKSLTKQAGEYLTLDNKKPRQALNTMVTGLAKIRVRENQSQISSFKNAYDIVMPEYMAQNFSCGELGIRLGWPYLDALTGGLYVGDKVSIVGRPATGKTWSLLYNGLTAWHEQKKTVLFISMEIKPLLIHQRLAAMHAHVPIQGLKTAQLATTDLNQVTNALLKI
jgi:replicative DNA helicase